MVYLGLLSLMRLLRMSKRKVYVYHGEGAEEKCRMELFASLKGAVEETYRVAYIEPADIIKGKLLNLKLFLFAVFFNCFII